MTFLPTTAFETEHIKARIAAGENGLIGPTIHRISIRDEYGSVMVYETTNDDDDDGFPDGEWKEWESSFKNVEAAMKYAGKCRIGFLGTIVTVTLNGKELR